MTSIVETERLILRDIDIERDLSAWTELMSDEDTVRFIGGKTLGRAECWRQMAMMIGHKQVRGYGFLSVVEKATDNWVGRVGHWFPEGWPEPEIGWSIHPQYTRRGFAKEAGLACVDYAYNVLGWERVIHVIAEGNIASEKTAQSIGSARLYQAPHQPIFGDLTCWVWGQERP